MEIRFGQKNMGDKEKKYVHMLNSTLCATTRGICAILENYQTPTGVRVPDVLVPFMGGMTFMPFIREAKVNSQQLKMVHSLSLPSACCALITCGSLWCGDCTG
jgi:seryl-tRNA synthetase